MVSVEHYECSHEAEGHVAAEEISRSTEMLEVQLGSASMDVVRYDHEEEEEKHHQDGCREVDRMKVKGNLGRNNQKLVEDHETKPYPSISVPFSSRRGLETPT